MQFAVIWLLFACGSCHGAYQLGKDMAIHKRAIEKLSSVKVADIKESFPADTDFAESKGFSLPRALAGWKHQGPRRYWYHPQIHTLGNTGVLGAFHSAICPLCTYIIDAAAYAGENVRERVAKELRQVVTKSGARIADLCCGVGISTQVLQDAFHDAELVVGLDTSPEMISMARLFTAESILGKVTNWHQQMASEFSRNLLADSVIFNMFSTKFPVYQVGNAERTPFPGRTFDLVTIMYAFHEVPLLGRYSIIREVRRLLREGGTLAIVDISPKYNPGPTMLAGEPYVLEYKANIHKQLFTIQGFCNVTHKEIVPDNVSVWFLTRRMATPSSKRRPLVWGFQ